MRARNGRYTVAEESRKIIAAGHGLSEREIERFYQRVDAIRNRHLNRPSNELRQMIERRYPS